MSSLQHPTHLHQGRTHSELGAPSSSSLRNVTIPCCIGSQPVRQVRALISLRDDHPAVYRDFVSGLHVVRRSDRLWAGLSTDLVIEQVLMRSLKASGGLTRGRGFTEQQQLIWLLSMPACAETNRAMQELMGVKSNSGEQNKDMSKARQKRDAKDTLVILTTFEDRDPFSADPNL